MGNFDFLSQHDERLRTLAALAERYFADDPNTCLIKLRQFAEALAQEVAARGGAFVSAQEPQVDLLRRLSFERLIPRQPLDLFHHLRKAGNDANHAGAGNHSDALTGLKVARELAVWFGEGKTRGQAAILDIPACNNQNCAAIRVSESGYPPEYVYWYLHLAYQATRNAGSGNNQPALNKDRVQRLPIPLAPVEEALEIARIIAAAFSWFDTVTDEHAHAAKLLPKLEQTILAKAFRGELVPQDPADEPASVLLERI